MAYTFLEKRYQRNKKSSFIANGKSFPKKIDKQVPQLKEKVIHYQKEIFDIISTVFLTGHTQPKMT